MQPSSQGSEPNNLDRPNRQFLALLLILFVVANYCGSVIVGLDWEQYYAWAKAALRQDINELDTGLVSVSGTPFFQWSSGPGMMLAPFAAIFGKFFQDRQVMEIAGIFYGILVWAILYVSFTRAFESRFIALTSILVAFLCTPLGFYSRAISGESLSLLPTSILFYQTILLAQNRSVCWWTIGCATAMLMMIRPYCAVYAWPVLFGGMIHLMQNRAWKAVATSLAKWCVPVAIGFGQLACTQYWMTGNPLHSPYSFGDDEFRSLDLMSPSYLWNIWFDSFHGMLSTFPLVGVGVALIVVHCVRSFMRRELVELVVWSMALAAISVNSWFQASWYYWWMGEYSLGMRGLVPVGFPAVASVMVAYRRCALLKMPLLLAIMMSAIWSWLQLRQGPTDYLSWATLLKGQWLELQSIDLQNWMVLLIGMVTSYLCVSSRQRFSAVVVTSLLTGVTAAYLNDRAFENLSRLLVIYVVLLVAYGVYTQLRRPHKNLLASETHIRFMAFVFFGSMTISFLPLAHHTNQSLTWPVQKRVSTFQEGDVQNAFQIMKAMGNHRDFLGQSERVESFLQRSGISLPKKPPPRRPFSYSDVKKRKLLNRYR